MARSLRRLPGLRWDVPAGLVDAGMASLAHFLVGLASVNLLNEADLGVYAVFFAAFMVAAVIPQFLVYTPAEVIAVSYPANERLSQLMQSLRLGVGPTLVGASVMVVAAVATMGETSFDVTLALALTAGTAVLVSPAQDHTRRLLHIAGRSQSAMIVSVVQFVSVAIGLGAMIAMGVSDAWIPFGALTLANVISIIVGMVLARSGLNVGAEPPLRFRTLARSGRWLLATALVPFAALFLGALLIVRLAGPEAMGYAEAARVAAQPLLVLGTGLNVVLGPRGMEAAIHGNLERARRALHLFLGLVLGVGLVYLVIVGIPWVGNPLVYLVPVAYEVDGLVAVTIVSHIVTAAAMQYMSELMGGRKEVDLTWVALLASPFILLGAATAAVTGAFARSIGVTLEASVRYGAYGTLRSRMYQANPDSESR